jgi:DNA-binding MarR family transcriptional regulator
MGSQKEVKRGRKPGRVRIPAADARRLNALSGEEWRKDLLVSWLFQTCIKLQTSLDRRFSRYGITMQEASVLLRCVEAQRITPGKLAVALGRDKGKVTRFIDRLESSRLVTRDVHWRDRRYSVIKPTRKGRQLAQVLAYVFASIRKELFAGILEPDVRRLGEMLTQLHKNATRIGSRGKCDAVRRRIGTHGGQTEDPVTRQLQLEGTNLTSWANRLAANSLPDEREARESQLRQQEQSSEELTDPGKVAAEHSGLVSK